MPEYFMQRDEMGWTSPDVCYVDIFFCNISLITR